MEVSDRLHFLTSQNV